MTKCAVVEGNARKSRSKTKAKMEMTECPNDAAFIIRQQGQEFPACLRHSKDKIKVQKI